MNGVVKSPARCARRTATQSGGLVWLSGLDGSKERK